MKIKMTRIEGDMDNYKRELLEQKGVLEKLLVISERNLKKLSNVEDTKVRITKSNGTDQYYTWNKGDKYVYVPSHKRELVRPLLQKNYEVKINRKIKGLLKEVSRFIDKYDFDEIQRIYCGSSNARKKYITPIIESDDEFVEKWLTEHAGNQNTYYEDGVFPTEKGDMVRSKSEKIIADLLYRYKIPYKYEPELVLRDGSQYYPDFMVLNVSKRKTVYWEHLGRIGIEDYSNKNLKKLLDYDRDGLVLGDNLIVSMESSEKPIDVKRIEGMIRRYFL